MVYTASGLLKVKLNIRCNINTFYVKGVQHQRQTICRYRTSQSIKNHQKEKSRKYNECTLQVEDSSFTPLVMSVTVEMSREFKNVPFTSGRKNKPKTKHYYLNTFGQFFFACSFYVNFYGF